MTVLQKVISGGQTGVDRAALDVALDLGIPCGGWCPLGRKAEDGRLPERYPLRETRSSSYAVRTRWNVRDSDGTLILSPTPLTGGTALTLAFARSHHRPVLIQRPDADSNQMICHVRDWIAEHHIHTLNVAGPRASSLPGIYQQACAFLTAVFKEISGHR